jgi:SAM-dependent methyltransferase
MRPEIFAAFERLCRRHGVTGSVLEIGALAAPDTLLELPALRACERRVGINVERTAQGQGWEMIQGNANDLGRFGDASFDAVLSNATLEHDPRFWLTVEEARRVLRPGGLLLIGVPGYVRQRSLASRAAGRLGRLAPLLRTALDGVAAATPTLLVHDYPGDYYRFSEQAMREVLLAGTRVVDLEVLGRPPRLIGVGRKT